MLAYEHWRAHIQCLVESLDSSSSLVNTGVRIVIFGYMPEISFSPIVFFYDAPLRRSAHIPENEYRHTTGSSACTMSTKNCGQP